jgi:hypothetical protein
VVLALLLCAACGDYQEGVSVTVHASVLPLTQRLDTATLSVATVALHSCPGAATPMHAGTGSTLLSLLAGGQQDLGRIHPAAGHYCELELALAPADETAAALPREGRDAVLGSTLRISTDAVDSRSAESTSVQLPCDVVLDESHREATLTLQLDAPRIFGGVDLAASDAATRALEQAALGTTLAP